MTEDEELALALAMSVEGNEPAASSGAGPAQFLPETAEPSDGGQQDADAMPGVSKQENTFAAANGAAQVGSITGLPTSCCVCCLKCHVPVWCSINRQERLQTAIRRIPCYTYVGNR